MITTLLVYRIFIWIEQYQSLGLVVTPWISHYVGTHIEDACSNPGISSAVHK